MKFWVVGREGLVGQEMCAYLREHQISFVGSSHREADILDTAALSVFYEKYKPTHIVNCVAYVDVDKAENEGKELAHLLNVKGVIHLRELAKRRGASLLHISTDYVFDGKKGSGYVETDPTNPINVYGQTKLEGESEALKYEKALSLRTASVYGFGKPGLISGLWQAIKTKDEVKHITDQISSPTYTKDIAEALFAVRDQVGVFHFVNRGEVSRYGLTLHLWQMAKRKHQPMQCKGVRGVSQKEAARPAERPVRSSLETGKIALLLGRSVRTWEEALEEYVDRLC